MASTSNFYFMDNNGQIMVRDIKKKASFFIIMEINDL